MPLFKKTHNTRVRKQKTFSEQLFEALFIVVPIAFLIRTFIYGLYQVPTGSMETTMLVGERFFADKFSYLFSKPKHGDIISFNDPRFDYSDNRLKSLWQMYVYGPSNITKRVIACPGDEIKGVMEDDKPIIYLKKKGESEFKKLDEPYLNKYPLILIYNPKIMKSIFRDYLYRSYDSNYSYENQPFYKMTLFEVSQGKILSKATEGKLPDLKLPNTPVMHDSKNFDEFHEVMSEDEYWVMGDNRQNSEDSRFWGKLKRKFIHGKIVFRIWSFDSYGKEEWWHIWIFDLINHPIDFWKRVRWSRCFQTLD